MTVIGARRRGVGGLGCTYPAASNRISPHAQTFSVEARFSGFSGHREVGLPRNSLKTLLIYGALGRRISASGHLFRAGHG
jgi:hypothetical protein